MIGSTGWANLAASRALVAGLAQSGVRQAVVCPGSRSTPLAVALLQHPDVRARVLIDERSAGYFALGMARGSGAPVALLSTSGTAAANFLPAVAEASLGRVPLVVLTADRPPELRGWGAAQTIDQLGLYGSHTRWFADLPLPDDEASIARAFQAAAARAARIAGTAPRGPVHLNIPFREPLLPADAEAIAWDPVRDDETRPSGVLDLESSRLAPSAAAVARLAERIARTPRGLIVCGPSDDPALPSAATALGDASGYPLLADPLSGLRFGPHDRSGVLTAYDPLLRVRGSSEVLAPEIVIRVGAIPTSKPLLQFLAAHPGELHLLIDPGAPRDPDHLATTVIQADEATTLRQLARNGDDRGFSPDLSWLERWQRADRRAAAAIADAVVGTEEPFEGRALAEVAALLPDGATLVVGNSMPVRDADAFIRGDERRIRVVANRGANGIDGVVSSALGAAAISDRPVVLVVGDLSFHHDLNGLLAGKQFGLSAAIVVVNNNGGGIFSFLPQATQLDQATFETLFGTPIGLDVAAAAQLYGADYARPRDWRALRRDVAHAIGAPGLSIVEVVTDRSRNVELHRRVWDAVRESLATVAVP